MKDFAKLNLFPVNNQKKKVDIVDANTDHPLETV